jgi:hypothetical protein
MLQEFLTTNRTALIDRCRVMVGDRSNLHRSEYDQAARYLKYACELLERHAFGRTVTLREVLEMAARRLSAGDHYVGDAAAEITVLCQVAEKVPLTDARTEIQKAIAVLRDRVGR